MNLGVLTLVSVNALNFFQGEMEELKGELPDVASVRVPEPQREAPKIDASRLGSDLYATAPVKRAPVEKKPKVDLPPAGPAIGGPLSTWEISSIIQSPDGNAFAFLLEVQEETTGLTPSRTSQRGRSMSRRNTSRRGSARRGRSSRNRGAQASNRATKMLKVGDVLNEDTSPSTIMEIAVRPPKVVYENSGRRYILDKRSDQPEQALSSEFDAQGRKVLVLTGRELDADEQQEAKARADAANASRGKISATKDDSKGKPAAKPATRTPAKKPIRSTDKKRAQNNKKDLKEALKKVPAKQREELERNLKKTNDKQ